jgi:alkylated DNA repair dioxygenase AlkB
MEIQTMEIQSKDSYLKLFNFDNKELLKKCVIDITNLLDEYPPPIKIYGKTCHQCRCVGFFSDDSIGYQYSKQLSLSKPMTISLLELLTHVNDIFGTKYNGILVNKYKSGEDYISSHSDDEKKLDDSGVIAISYGATRKFRIRDKKTKQIVKDFPLISYNMLQMGGSFQQEFTHEIPIERKIKDERISFTFRRHTK